MLIIDRQFEPLMMHAYKLTMDYRACDHNYTHPTLSKGGFDLRVYTGEKVFTAVFIYRSSESKVTDGT